MSFTDDDLANFTSYLHRADKGHDEVLERRSYCEHRQHMERKCARGELQLNYEMQKESFEMIDNAWTQCKKVAVLGKKAVDHLR